MGSGGRRLVVGISGASGTRYGIRALERLRELGIESHLVVTRAGGMTRAVEAELSARELRAMADVSHSAGEIGASIASGSFQTMGMLVAPPVPAFYARPSGLEEMVDYTVARVLDLFGLRTPARRWEGMAGPTAEHESLAAALSENGSA